MKNNSLSNKITLVFIFSIALLCMFFFVLMKYQSEKNLENMKERQLQSINYIFVLYRNNLSPQGINEYFSNFGLKPVQNANLKASVLSKGVVVFQKSSALGEFSSIIYNDKYYLHIDNLISSILLESKYNKRPNDILWLIFAAALVLLISIYISILRSISPLKQLSSEIKKFASGQLDIDCKSDKDDEIAEVANEFDRAASKLKDLINSRQLFLRTIMHELKTPIGKGRIVAEMLQDVKAKNRLVSIFERLDLLISEFSKLEQIVSKNYSLQIKEHKFVNILEQAIDLLMLEEEKRALHVNEQNVDESLYLKADFDSFSLALKNLMDNAIKYSPQKRVYVRTEGKKIYIENFGKPLEMDIEEYEKPFVSGKNELKPGLGLGLYIVKNIIKLNNLELSYEYKDEKHCFIIDTGDK
ncbi:MAG TPA: histidine kinase [Sulfurospirillum sp. UBA12182]|jgi:two-component system OmpR family sensor kinase|nr:MAG TPA: histidine kinase [Sulfurospirillum sp. UBA12182]